MNKIIPLAALGLVAAALTACSTLLPDSRVRTEESWKSYDEATRC